MNQSNPRSFVRASIRYIKSVQLSDDPEHFYSGPEYDLYEVNVEHGPSGAFLMWFHQTNAYDLCRVGSTSEFVDLGSAKPPAEGKVLDLTYDEFFPQWLDTAVSVAKADLARMAREATSKLALA